MRKAEPIYVLSSLVCGGDQRMVLEIVHQLLQRGIAVDLIVMQSGGEFWNSIPTGTHLMNFNSSELFKQFDIW